MSKLLKFALEEQRNYYSQKLLAIGVYNNEVLRKMTISELKNEYVYFYHSIPAIKRKPASP
ncbi:Fur-regulated basic protein FbpA [Metabacillus sp. 84]|uniref:Fur-regulated basic protein FbpA n=1 Tax=unclassified Metabacillus TaxID=2675274 RepID=UPI003CF77310